MCLGDPWATHVDNHITYHFDMTRCMFSRGNITEKLRIARFDCRNEIVVDLYAGIGYFVLPYLVHAKAMFLHACEWNPDAVAALQQNLIVNRVAARCQVYAGDNAKVCPTDVADRVNLGLIPTSKMGWPVAVAALKKSTGGWLHVHENITTKQTVAARQRDEWDVAGQEIAAEFKVLLEARHGNEWQVDVRHVECVKSYAPLIYHMVFDLECRPVVYLSALVPGSEQPPPTEQPPSTASTAPALSATELALSATGLTTTELTTASASSSEL
eukprot:m.186815 g.186815  ORF g.186815 m.186815 type:complete len:271 (+) comp53568_c0_seq4:544-1356(+)